MKSLDEQVAWVWIGLFTLIRARKTGSRLGAGCDCWMSKWQVCG
jgi:hypothetical protein